MLSEAHKHYARKLKLHDAKLSYMAVAQDAETAGKCYEGYPSGAEGGQTGSGSGRVAI